MSLCSRSDAVAAAANDGDGPWAKVGETLAELGAYGSFLNKTAGELFFLKDKSHCGLQQPRVIPRCWPYRVVIGVEPQFYRLFAQPNDLAEAAANRDGPLAPARDPVRRDIRRRAHRPSIREMIADDRIEQYLVGSVTAAGGPPKDQILLTTAPNTHGLEFWTRNATDGPEPHLLTPSAEFVAVG